LHIFEESSFFLLKTDEHPKVTNGKALRLEGFLLRIFNESLADAILIYLITVYIAGPGSTSATTNQLSQAPGPGIRNLGFDAPVWRSNSLNDD
jgi:hypothetical protein